MRAGLMGGADRVGHQESGNTPANVRAQRGRTRGALFCRVVIKDERNRLQFILQFQITLLCCLDGYGE